MSRVTTKSYADLQRDLTEAREQQTATSEILRVISSSPTDMQPVFDAIARNARGLLAGHSVSVTRLIGDEVHLMAFNTVTPEGDAVLRAGYPVRLDQLPLAQRTVREGTAAFVEDVETHPDATERTRRVARARGFRSFVWMPMVHGGATTGWISVTWAEPGPFSASHIALLQTFADQAVIALESVRLFNETTEALEQQTATADILSVISASPTDIVPVFDAILERATALCEAHLGILGLYESGRYRQVAHRGASPEFEKWLFSEQASLVRDLTTGIGRMVATRKPVHIVDLTAEPAYRDRNPARVATVEIGGARTFLAVPMLKEGRLAGGIVIYRPEVRAFSQRQIDLLQTFANQAVIAIENGRLFKELEARTQDLTRSVGELRALGEVGQAINSSLDLRTVLSTIVARATQLSGTDAGVIYEYDEQREVFLPRATAHLEAEIVETMLATPVRKGEGATGRLAEEQEPVQVPDMLAAPSESRVRGGLVRAGYRALLAVPLVREDHMLGGLTVIRKATGEFRPEVIDLLRTFATQSALAIQNARLFLEIEDKSRQLEVASQHKSEFLANMSHELRTPLNAIIGFSEVLTEGMFGEINDKQAEYLRDILESGRHLLSLINDILDLSKIEAGRMELEPADFDLPTAIDNALTLVRERAGRQGIALGRQIDERLGTIRADERKVKQVLLNLLSNALKFTSEGGRIDVHAVLDDGLVEVSVADTGVGIAPEDQEAIFEEFRQVGTADKKVEGTGLGLALSRKFIELHGGRIWVQSEVGRGSTFTFTIPVNGS